MDSRKATRKDKEAVLNILCDTFKTDPQITWIVGENGNAEKRLSSLMSYAFEYALRNDNIEITNDQQAVAIWKCSTDRKKFSLPFLAASVRFLLAYGIKQFGKVEQMGKQINRLYPSDERYDYLWFLGTLPVAQGKGYASSLINKRLHSKSDNKYILLETSTTQNVAYYERKGFKIYGEITLEGLNEPTVYLLKAKLDV